MKRFTILAVILMAFGSIEAQTHSFAMWLSGGYNNHNTKIEGNSYTGHGGGNIGLGYDLQVNNFMLQFGGEFQHYASQLKFEDFTDSIPMVNTQGEAYKGIFDFENSREKQQFGNAAAVLKIGFVTTNPGTQFYANIGGKFAYNIYGNTHTYTTVKSSGIYDDIIGDGNGQIGNMPNHDYYTGKRDYKEKITLNPTIYGSVEAGLQFTDARFLGATPRLAVFFDMGFTSLGNKPKDIPDTRLINISDNDQFKPALRPRFYNAQTDKFNTYFAGLKLTLLWSGDNTSYCHCIGDQKAKITKAKAGKGASYTPKRYKKKARKGKCKSCP